MTLQPMTGGVCTDWVVQAYQIPLTNGRPNQERYWDVPDLSDGRGECDARSRGYSRVKIV